MIRLLLVPFALVLLLVGLILAPTPIPFGLPMIAVALFLLLGASPMAIRLLRRARRRWSRLDGWFALIEDKAPVRIARTFRRSRPRRRAPS